MQDLESSLAVLQEKNWNLQRALEMVFDNGPSSSREREDQVPLLPAASTISSSQQPLRVPSHPQPPRPSFLRLFALPFLWSFRLVWTVLSFACKTKLLTPVSWLPFLRTHRRLAGSRLTPIDAAREFQKEFTATYGDKTPKFFEGAYSLALERAKQNLQYLLVVLQSDLHDETRSMAQGTLTNDSFLNYLTEKNILVWGGNIRESEAFK
ncbi:hypothetical protein HDU91_002717, partial [Kappamyces sp. JEL0680]